MDTKKVLGDWCENIKINNYEYDKTRHSISKEVESRLIITMGPDGCQHQDVVYTVPKVEIKDASGAGDTFISSLAVKFVQTRNIKKSIIYANECATIVVQKRGVSVV